MVIGLIATVAALIIFLIVGSVLESSGFQFGSGTTNDNQEVLPYVGVSEMQTILNSTSGEGTFVYIGRPTCPACQRYEPILRELLRDLDGSVAYFEIDRARETEADYEMTVTEINQIIGVTGVPHLVFIRDGEVVDFADGHTLLGGDSREVTLEFFERNGGLN